jgi:hypothetical protein
MHGEADGAIEHPQDSSHAKTVNGKAEGDKPHIRNGTSVLKIHTISGAVRSALELQAESLISQVQPTSSSFFVRDAVFKFVQKCILECFHDFPVRLPGAAFCYVSV